MTDELETLRKAVKRALRNSQYRVSVSPAMVSLVLRERDEALARLEAIEGTREPGIEHKHRTDRGEKIHTHPKGDIPHGHHGWRYAGIVRKIDKNDPDMRPRIVI